MNRQVRADNIFDSEIVGERNVILNREINQLSMRLAASNALLCSALDQLDEARAEIDQLRNQQQKEAAKSKLLSLPQYFQVNATQRIRQQLCPALHAQLG